MKFLPLLCVHVFSICCHRWLAAASVITCEAVSHEASAEPSCHPVGDCIEVATPSDSSESRVRCLDSKPCPSSKLSDGKAINYNSTDRTYSIDGLPRFNGSHIGYCPSVPDPRDWRSAACSPESNSRFSITSVENLQTMYQAIDAKFYNATLKWTYPDTIPEAVKAYKLFVYAPGVTNYPGYCICIESSLMLTEYTLTLEYSESRQSNAIINVVTFPLFNGINGEYPPFDEIHDEQFPANCLDYRSGSSNCGTPIYGKPRNVQVHKSVTHTMVSWDKPCYQDSDACKFLGKDDSEPGQSEPNTYYLTATVNSVTNHFVVYNTTKVTLSTTDPVNFKLYTHTPCLGVCEVPFFPDGCSQPATSPDEPDNQTCCVSVSSTSTSPQVIMTTTPTPRDTTTTPSRTNYAIVSVTIVIGLALVVVVILLVSFFCYKRHNPVYGKPADETPTPTLFTPSPVLVVFSPRTSELESQTILQYLVSDLTGSPYGVESSTYGIGQLRQSLSEWMEERHRDARAVLCVCNREFSEDWAGSYTTVDGSPQVVRTLKQLFEGDMQQTPSGTRKYAVIKMKATDDQFIPPLLKSRPAYMYNQVDEIARFSCNQPKYEYIV